MSWLSKIVMQKNSVDIILIIDWIASKPQFICTTALINAILFIKYVSFCPYRIGFCGKNLTDKGKTVRFFEEKYSPVLELQK